MLYSNESFKKEKKEKRNGKKKSEREESEKHQKVLHYMSTYMLFSNKMNTK